MKDNDKKVFKSLLINKDFRDWVYNPTENRDLYWNKWIEANKELEQVARTAHQSVTNLKFKKDELPQERLEELLNNVISDKNSITHSKVTYDSKRWKVWAMLVAAVLVLCAVPIFITMAYSVEIAQREEVSMKRIYNPMGRKSVIRLPDGSTVNLNAGSELTFPTEFTDSLRIVELSGEAFFDVAKDDSKPFVVLSGELQTRVLGTQFNVAAYKDDQQIDIALVEGKVKVRAQSFIASEGVKIIYPGQLLAYDREHHTYRKKFFERDDLIAWKEGVLVLDNLGFDDFLMKIRRWYGVDVEVVGRPNKKWNIHGRFDKESLEEVLLGVQFTHGIQFEIKDRKVIISCD